MTITTALSPARSHAFHATEAAQKKQGGPVQFSLPPINDPSSAAGKATPPAAINRLPIAVPIAAQNGLGSVTTLPADAAPVSAIAANTAPGQGNVLSARLISRLYQQS